MPNKSVFAKLFGSLGLGFSMKEPILPGGAPSGLPNGLTYQGQPLTLENEQLTLPTASERLYNGSFAEGALGWQGGGYSGMSIADGKMLFSGSPQWDGFQTAVGSYPLTLETGKYYDVSFTISEYVAGAVRIDLLGGVTRSGLERSENGTFVQSLQANAGNNQLMVLATGEAPNTFKIDNVSVYGPFDIARTFDRPQHKEFYTIGSYSAYANMWALEGNPAYLEGRDFVTDWQLRPSSFPAESILRWEAPTGSIPGSPGVWGYHHFAYGNYDWSDQQADIEPRQVNGLGSLLMTFDWQWSGIADFNLLSECWLTSAAVPAGTTSTPTSGALFEIGFFLHMPSYDFHNGGVEVGTWNGWTVRAHNHHILGAERFITFAKGVDVLSGSIDWEAALLWLVAQGRLSGAEWVNGLAFGIEPTEGGGEGVFTTNALQFQMTGAS